MIAKVNRNILIGFLILFFMTWSGIDSVVATTRTSIVDEMLNAHILKMQKIEKGEKVFMQLLEERKDQIPVIGTPDYVKLLFYYADPSGSLRHSNPQKWELVDAYAYDFYEKHMLPRVSPEDAGKQYYEPLALVNSPSQLRLGDVIQIDFTSDGTIDHTMVVTMIDSSGNIRVSQHTTNRTNEPLINYFSPGRAFYYLNITY